jgi:glycosyltransferase involved in cell wall biosynthesis
VKISVLIPTKDRLEYLKRSLTSAREQTYSELEILVSDDGSADGTRAFVRDIEAEDERVRLVSSNPRPGQPANYNWLIGQSTGDAFAILDDDDIWLPGFVNELVEPLRKTSDVVASFCDHWLMDANGLVLEELSDRIALACGRADLQGGTLADPLTQALQGSIAMGFSLLRSDVFKQVRYNPTYESCADIDYILRAVQLGKFYYVKKRLGMYRFHDAQMTRSRYGQVAAAGIRIFGSRTFPEPRHELLRRILLLSSYRTYALFVCTQDRSEWLNTMKEMLALGVSPLDKTLALSLFLAWLPRSVAVRVKTAIRSFRIGVTNSG